LDGPRLFSAFVLNRGVGNQALNLEKDGIMVLDRLTGRIINPGLAISQCKGGMVGGIGMALMERTILDPRDGRAVNAHMADYLVPVNLDIPELEAYLIEEEDSHVNPLEVKGLGELAMIGVAPAIANAIFHATGKRMRELPIRIENLLDISVSGSEATH
jgi:xanthine dehydrogenase YagR molybdenum-binding subunit